MPHFERVAEADRGFGNRLATRLFFPLLILLFMVLLVFFGVFWTGEVSGDSMLPGLVDADLMLVTRGYDRPARGDVIVIESHPYESGDEGIVKRVVALPGDEVEITNSRAYVNGIAESGYDLMIQTGSHGRDADVPAMVVPAGHVFVLGDNRAVSLDSRSLGPIPMDDVRGRVVAVFAPINHIGMID